MRPYIKKDAFATRPGKTYVDECIGKGAVDHVGQLSPARKQPLV